MNTHENMLLAGKRLKLLVSFLGLLQRKRKLGSFHSSCPQVSKWVVGPISTRVQLRGESQLGESGIRRGPIPQNLGRVPESVAVCPKQLVCGQEMFYGAHYCSKHSPIEPSSRFHFWLFFTRISKSCAQLQISSHVSCEPALTSSNQL